MASLPAQIPDEIACKEDRWNQGEQADLPLFHRFFLVWWRRRLLQIGAFFLFPSQSRLVSGCTRYVVLHLISQVLGIIVCRGHAGSLSGWGMPETPLEKRQTGETVGQDRLVWWTRT